MFDDDGTMFKRGSLKSGRLKGVDMVLPEQVWNYLKRDRANAFDPGTPEANRIIRFFDVMNNTFKLYHTGPFASFHARNAIGNLVAVGTAAGLMPMVAPKAFFNTARMFFGGKEAQFTMTDAFGNKYLSQQVLKQWAVNDVNPQRLRLAELVTDEGTLGLKLGSKVKNRQIRKLITAPDRAAGKIAGGVGQNTENFFRAWLYNMELLSGKDPATAAQSMKRFLFDYNDLSEVEQRVFRRVLPFWTWSRKNMQLQLEILAQRPGVLTSQLKVFNEGERGPDAELLPNFMRGEMKVGLGRHNGRTTFITGIDLPINNLNMLWAGDVGSTMREWFHMITPAIKNPIEYMIGLDTFSEQSIQGRRFMGQFGEIADKAWPEPIKEWLELRPVNSKDGETYYTANGTKLWLFMKNMIVGRIVSETTRTAAMLKDFGDGNPIEGSKQFVRLTSGMRWTEIELDKGQEREWRRKNREIEDYMLKKGILADFTVKYQPTNNRPGQSTGAVRTGFGSGGSGGMFGSER